MCRVYVGHGSCTPSAMSRHAQVFKLFSISPLCRLQLAPLRILSSSPHGIYSLLSDSSLFSCEHQKWLRAFSCGQNVRQLGLNHRAEFESRKDLRDGMQEGDARTASLNGGGLRRRASTASEDPKLDQEVAEEITLTDNCRIREIKLEDGPTGENKMLRLSVEGGGCSGFLYNFALDDKVNEDDRIFERDGSKLLVDDISLSFIKGATVDFTDELIRSFFAVTINLNAASACGCGASFNAT